MRDALILNWQNMISLMLYMLLVAAVVVSDDEGRHP
jgi:hypothetical protein